MSQFNAINEAAIRRCTNPVGRRLSKPPRIGGLPAEHPKPKILSLCSLTARRDNIMNAWSNYLRGQAAPSARPMGFCQFRVGEVCVGSVYAAHWNELERGGLSRSKQPPSFCFTEKALLARGAFSLPW